MRLPVILAISGAAFLPIGLTGCADPQHWKPPVSEELRASFGTVGLVGLDTVPDIQVDTPAKGSLAGAGRKAGGWTRDWLLGGPRGCSSGGSSGGGIGTILCAAVWLGLTPVVAMSGAVYGAATAEDAATVKKAETQLKDSLAKLRYGRALRDHVADEAKKYSPTLALFPLDQANLGNTDSSPDAPRAKDGINTILEIEVESIGVNGQWDVDPPLAITVKAKARMLESRSGKVLHDDSFRYTTKTRSFSDWAKDDAKAFSEAIDLSLQRLSEFMVERLFFTFPFTHEHVNVIQQESSAAGG